MKERVYIMIKKDGKKVAKGTANVKVDKPKTRAEAEKKMKESLTKEQQVMVNNYIQKLLEEDRRRNARLFTVAWIHALHDVHHFGKVRLSDAMVAVRKNLDSYISDKKVFTAAESEDWCIQSVKIADVKMGKKNYE